MKESTVRRRIFRRALTGARMVVMSILISNDLRDALQRRSTARFSVPPSARSASFAWPAPTARDGRNMTPVPHARQKKDRLRSRSLVFLFTVLAALLHAPLAAHGESTRAAARGSSAMETEPTEATALSAYLAARAWLDADALPAEGDAAARVPLEATTAVCVLLRLDGRLVGAGHDELEHEVREGRAQVWEGDKVLPAAADAALFYEVLPHSKIASQVLEVARRLD